LRIGISCYPTHGGSGVVATELGKHLAERGHDVAFISYDTPLRLSELPPRVSYHEVEIEQYPLLKHFPYTLALASKMAEVARINRLEILHAHYAIPFGAAALLAKQILSDLPLKVVTTLHGTDITLVGSNASFRPVTKLAIERADAVTAVSTFLQQETYRQFAVDRDVQVIHNFIDPDRHDITPCPCLQEHLVSSRKTVMHISNFRPVKRIRDVVEVFTRIAAAMDARLVLVGDGPDLPVAREIGEKNGVSDRMKFVGVVDSVAPLLAVADLLLLPSSMESFGLVALEAMASGVPVIASNVGGLPEVVEHGTTGYLAPVGDVDQMAKCAIELLTDERLHDRYSQAARRRAQERFDYRTIIPEYEALYRRVAESA
jgi:N-acetyl-alpha-D-glucosaminyl L-malate synthase BshA